MFCLATGQTPQVYAELTRLERQAFYDVIERSQAKK